MKLQFFVAHVAITATLGLAISARAQTDWERAGLFSGPIVTPKPETPSETAQRINNARLKFAHGQIYRVSNGKIYNVVENQQWQFIGGTVYEKSGQLVIFQQPTGRRADWTYAAITNFQGEALIDKEFDGLAIRAGTFLWNGDRPIAIYDMGKPYVPTPEEIAAAKAAKEQAAKAAITKAYQLQSNAIRWLQPQATNGDASAQCSLGIHYLNGQGCETNREQAIYWLKKAADQGDAEASNTLTRLQN